MRRHTRLGFCTTLSTLAILATLGSVSPVAADYQVRGRFLYRDRAFSTGGFTGSDTDKPIRHADVQVVDDGNVVRGSGTTNATGNFTINVVDNVTRNVYVRVSTKSDNSPPYVVTVRQTVTNAIFALVSSTYSAHPSNQDIDFTGTPVVALQTASAATIGEPFNIYDQAVDAFDFIASVNGGTYPVRPLTIYWARGTNDGTFYRDSDATIHLFGLTSDSDGYDDTVILHEIGHYTEYNLADSDNPGGPHSLDDTYDLRLTWSEGWATFFANNVRQFRGIARADIYVDTAGQPGPGQAFLSYEVETPSAGVLGADNEVSVNAVLWDITDTPASLDASAGSDDDGLNLANGPQDFWDVFEGYFPTATSISLEDFWDGWFSPPYSKGHLTEMRAIFSARGIEYFPDAFEPNNSSAQARTIVGGSPAEHLTTYGAGDDDWFIIAVQGGAPYTFETTNLLSGADTRLELFQSNGTTLIAANDDRSAGNPSSRINHTPPSTATVYLRCRRKSDSHTYGSYDILVTGPAVPVSLSDLSMTADSEGIRLHWRAEHHAGFSHFEIERGDNAAGPWTVLEGAPETSAPGEYDWLDRDVRPGARYHYRIISVETGGERQVFGPYVATALAPARLALHSPQPNPFNPTTTITFELARASRPSLFVYGADGRLVRTLVSGQVLQPGPHTTRWDGRDTAGDRVASGVYWIRLEADGTRLVRSAVLVR